jgi:hypothetical protein
MRTDVRSITDCPTCGRRRHLYPGVWSVLCLVVLALDITAYVTADRSWWIVMGLASTLTLLWDFVSEWLGRKSIDQ